MNRCNTSSLPNHLPIHASQANAPRRPRILSLAELSGLVTLYLHPHASPIFIPKHMSFAPVADQLDLITKGAAEIIPPAAASAPDALAARLEESRKHRHPSPHQGRLRPHRP